ncbi:MAG: hypothetical protein JWP01_1894 [Myxococcales bacterium]|nr:hypothetical protein [Myxococcales bacterium]
MLCSLVAIALATSTPAPELHAAGVNLYIGDLSAIVGGYVPSLDGMSPAEAEQARVRGHLSFTHDMLATVDTSTWPVHLREARARNLRRLASYAERGEFPHDDDHPDR